jgi:hypothetical protein
LTDLLILAQALSIYTSATRTCNPTSGASPVTGQNAAGGGLFTTFSSGSDSESSPSAGFFGIDGDCSIGFVVTPGGYVNWHAIGFVEPEVTGARSQIGRSRQTNYLNVDGAWVSPDETVFVLSAPYGGGRSVRVCHTLFGSCTTQNIGWTVLGLERRGDEIVVTYSTDFGSDEVTVRIPGVVLE